MVQGADWLRAGSLNQAADATHSVKVTRASPEGFSVPKGFVLGHFYFVVAINRGVVNGFRPAAGPYDFGAFDPVDCPQAKVNGL